MNASEQAFRKILQNYPDLCACGMEGRTLCERLQTDFQAERRRLEEAYDEFVLCCDWLLDCIPLKHVSFVSPLSQDLADHVQKVAETPITNGALIAAVLHMRIPCHPLPDSPQIRVGISLRSPALGDHGSGKGLPP